MNILIISEIEEYINNILKSSVLINEKIIISNNYKQNQDITIVINQSIELINEINNYTRLNNSKLIVLFTNGIDGYFFIDYGINYKYLENDNNNIVIQNILNDGTIACLENHNLEINDIIEFKQLEGENVEFINKKDWIIREIINNKIIKIENLNEISFNFVNGILKKKDNYKILNHNKFNIDLLEYNKDIKLEYNYNFITLFFCGIITYEIYKILINKYKPIDQYYKWDKFENINFNKLSEINLDNIFINIIGNNKLGNEYLKHLFLLNIKNIKLIDYNDSVLDKIENNNIIISTLDDIENKKIIARECFKKNISFFDNAISKNMGYIFPVIPFITETYENINDFEYKQSYLPCIINNFPYNEYHTIEWAEGKYQKIIKKYKLNDNLYQSINTALILFNKLFNKCITKLLNNLDLNVWSNGKKKPQPIIFNNNNKLHIKFIELTIQLISDYNIKYSSNFIINDISKDKLTSNLIKTKWIKYCSKIRMSNYNILYNKKEKNCFSIINILTSLTIIEIIKYIIKNDNYIYNTTFINLNKNLLLYSDCLKPNNLTINNQEINIWTKFKYEKNTSIKEFKEYYEKLFNIIITMLIIDTTIIYNEDLGINNLNKQLTEIINKNGFISLLTDNDVELPDIEIIL